MKQNVFEGGLWHDGRASHSELRGPGFYPHLRAVLSLWARHIYSPKYWFIPRKWCLCPNMTEFFLAGTLNFKTNKQTNVFDKQEQACHSYFIIYNSKSVAWVFVLRNPSIYFCLYILVDQSLY